MFHDLVSNPHTYAQKVILLTDNILQNNPPRLPHIFANDEEGAVPSAVCDASMCTTSHQNSVKMSSLFSNLYPCSGVFNFRMRSKLHGLRSGEWRVLQDLLPPLLQKVLDTGCSFACCIIMEDYCIDKCWMFPLQYMMQIVLQKWSGVCGIGSAALTNRVTL